MFPGKRWALISDAPRTEKHAAHEVPADGSAPLGRPGCQHHGIGQHRPPAYRRREFIAIGIGGVAAVSLGAAFWDDLFSSADGGGKRARPGYGPRRRPDGNGVRLPEGFRSRVIAEGGKRVPRTEYVWHQASDGAATFPTEDGGFILVSNSETLEGGASAIRFRRDGSVADAYRILEGTTQNCSGGGTPWGTWLSCEEVEDGRVWECDPLGRRKATARPAMGVFKHEAAAVDPDGRHVYLTEDLIDGGFYRFTPERWPDLGSGTLEIATVRGGGGVEWTRVPDPAADSEPTRQQVPGSTELKRGEGIWFDSETVYVATTGDNRVHAYDTRRRRMRVLYDPRRSRQGRHPPPLLRVDQLTASPAGELFVCEDPDSGGEIDIGLITPGRQASRLLSVTGPEHQDSELTGATFDPSGTRLYFSSQRARGTGVIYEVTGPFRR